MPFVSTASTSPWSEQMITSKRPSVAYITTSNILCPYSLGSTARTSCSCVHNKTPALRVLPHPHSIRGIRPRCYASSLPGCAYLPRDCVPLLVGLECTSCSSESRWISTINHEAITFVDSGLSITAPDLLLPSAANALHQRRSEGFERFVSWLSFRRVGRAVTLLRGLGDLLSRLL